MGASQVNTRLSIRFIEFSCQTKILFPDCWKRSKFPWGSRDRLSHGCSAELPQIHVEVTGHSSSTTRVVSQLTDRHLLWDSCLEINDLGLHDEVPKQVETWGLCVLVMYNLSYDKWHCRDQGADLCILGPTTFAWGPAAAAGASVASSLTHPEADLAGTVTASCDLPFSAEQCEKQSPPSLHLPQPQSHPANLLALILMISFVALAFFGLDVGHIFLQ